MKIRIYTYLCWFFVLIFALLQFDLQLIQSFFTNELSSQFRLSNTGIADLSSALFYAYLIMQIPAGLILSKFKLKYVLGIGVLITALGCLLFGSSQNLLMAYLSRVLIGAGSSFAYIGLMVVIKDLFAPSIFPLMMGLSEFITIMGAGFIENLFAYTNSLFGWRETCDFIGLLMLLLSILVYHSCYIIETKFSKSSATSSGGGNVKKNIINLFRNKVVIYSALYGFGVYGICSGFGALWAIPLLKINYAFIYNSSHPNVEASFVLNMLLFGIGAGSLVQGWLSMKVEMYLLMILSSLLLLLLCIIFLITHISNEVSLKVLFFMIGMCVSSYILSFNLSKISVKKEEETMAISFTNLFIVSGTVVLQPLIGFLLDIHRSISITKLKILTSSDFYFALWVLPLRVYYH